MRLFYKPGACSLASHIMLYEVGADFETEAVDTEAKRSASGLDYRDTNPNGYVPALEIAEGVHLTEGAAILQYIADTHSATAFAPAPGSIARARLQQFLNFASAELHKAWGPLFAEGASEARQAEARGNVAVKFDYLEQVLSDGREFLVENRFSAADAYTFVLALWSGFKDIDLTGWPNLAAYVARIRSRPATQAAMRAEGLL